MNTKLLRNKCHKRRRLSTNSTQQSNNMPRYTYTDLFDEQFTSPIDNNQSIQAQTMQEQNFKMPRRLGKRHIVLLCLSRDSWLDNMDLTLRAQTTDPRGSIRDLQKEGFTIIKRPSSRFPGSGRREYRLIMTDETKVFLRDLEARISL